ncbi:alanine--tRNA ligase [[Mycoplasma] testudinis]|uniref:alanine--tRNA ligase n=1 Tax=[Mycoplasma] testudinis TaxID=33924 RepID=UPI000485EC1E|nr:alanine--tRNA ligase [[Mycoplasma] testudinis]
MKKLTGNQVRQVWIDFFKKHQHFLVDSQSLVPKNDPSLLWINAGVATLKDYFSGKTPPPAPRLVNSQRCLRTNDIENVGVTSRHQTLFEMLGNFSIGDYFKKQAIHFGYDLLVNHYGLDVNKLYISVFEEDDDAYNNWIEVGIKPDHLVRCNRERNFWDLGSGPCGPCTEIFYDRGEKYDPQKIGVKLFQEDIENDRYVEIWNIVFSQFNNDGKNNYSELTQKNIDTGSGLERLTSVLQEVPTNFDTDLFLPIIQEIEKYTNQKYVIDDYFSKDPIKHKRLISFRVIADHLKACVFAISDGVVPGSKERSYIIRRLLRRALVHSFKLNIKEDFFETVVKKIIEIYQDFFPYLATSSDFIIKTLKAEEQTFKTTINNGLAIFNQAVQNESLDGRTLFKLVETYGFPVELTKELAAEKNIKLNWNEFDVLFKEHQAISKAKNGNVIGIEKQNPNLLALEVKSEFDYYANNIQAQVVALFDDQFNRVESIVNSSGFVVFDKTVIYATSGGQRFDEGYAIKDNIKVHFDNVLKAPHLQHLHHFTNASFKLNEKWTLSHDPEWRRLVRKNHTLEHVLHAALKKIIGPTIKQEGAFKSAQKATLDFTYPTRLSDEQITNVENEIRRIIALDIPIQVIHTDLEGSKKLNAIAYFADEYKKHDQLRVIKIGDYSVELCGGTHLDKTSEIEDCYIFDHSSRGAGSWRIEILSSFETTKKYLQQKNESFVNTIEEIKKEYQQLKLNNPEFIKSLQDFKIPQDIKQLRSSLRHFETILDDYHKIKLEHDKSVRLNEIQNYKKLFVNNIENNVSFTFLQNGIIHEINDALTAAVNENQDILFIVFNQEDKKIQYFVATKSAAHKMNANQLVQEINKKFLGRGGGKPNFAQGGTTQVLSLNQIREFLKEII